LWEVERDGQTSHLLGTCHLPIPLDHVLPSPHQAVLPDARVLFTELQLGQMTAGDQLGAVLRDHSLRAQLGDESWDMVSRSLRLAIPAPMLDRMPGWAAYATLSMFRNLDVMGRILEQMESGDALEVVPILDLAVEQAASAAGVEQRALETFDQQVAMLDEHDAAFIEALVGVRETASRDARLMQQMRTACFDGEISALNAVLAESQGTPMMRALLDDRNAQWLSVLRPELAQGRVLVAAGAAHMVGPAGLVAALEADGYHVRALTGRESGWERPTVAVDQSGLDDFAEIDPDRIEAAMGGAADFVSAICAPEGPIVQCLVPSAAACEESMSADYGLCVRQHAEDLPPVDTPVPPEVQQRIAGCAGAGVAIGAMVGGEIGDAPVCEMFQAMVDQMGQGAMGMGN